MQKKIRSTNGLGGFALQQVQCSTFGRVSEHRTLNPHCTGYEAQKPKLRTSARLTQTPC